MLCVAIEKLVHDVHDVCESCHFPNLLKTIFRRLALLCLFKCELLKAVACELLDGVDLPVASGRTFESFRGSLQSNFISPTLKVLPMSHLVLAPGHGSFEVRQSA